MADVSFNTLRLWDPLAASTSAGALGDMEDYIAADDSFTAALLPSSSQPTLLPSISETSPDGENLLIDFAPTPRPTSKPLLLSSSSSSKRQTLGAPSSSRKASPLKFSFFEDSFDESSVPSPFGLGQPSVMHRQEEDVENSFGAQPKRSSGKKWGVMSKVKEERNRRRSRSLSPVKERISPLKEGNSSIVLSAHHLDAGDLSLIADEGDSFLLAAGTAGDVTLGSFALPQIGKEDEQGSTSVAEDDSAGMSQLLHGLNASTIGRNQAPFLPRSRMPTSQSVPALSSILPSSLNNSTRPALSRSLSLSRSVSLAAAELPPVPPIDAETEPEFSTADVSAAEPSLLSGLSEPSFIGAADEPSFLVPAGEPSLLFPPSRKGAGAEASFFALPGIAEGGEDAGEGGIEHTLLDVSTASFKEYRDSPVKPRVATIQEEWGLDNSSESEKDMGKTPRPSRKGRTSDVSSSEGEDGTSGSSFDLTGWKTGEYGTILLNQKPPPAALNPESTGTLLIGLQTPLRPSAASIFAPSRFSSSFNSQHDLLSCSTNTLIPSNESSTIEIPTPSSPVASESPLPPAPTQVEAAGVPEGDLLGIGKLAPSPPKPPVPTVVTPGRKQESGADRLKRRLEELRAQKQKAAQPGAPVSSSTATPRQRTTSSSSRATLDSRATTPEAPHPFAASRPSTVSRGGKTLKASRSSPNLVEAAAPPSRTAPAPRLAGPRQSTLPTSAASTRPSTPPRNSSIVSTAADGSKTPGERKESTHARLERLKAERKQREQAKSPEKKAVQTGLARRASVAVPSSLSGALQGTRRTSMAPPVAGAERAMTASRSVGDLRPPAGSSGLARPSTRPACASTSASTARPASSTASRPSLAPRPSTVFRPPAGLPRPSTSSSASSTSASSSATAAPRAAGRPSFALSRNSSTSSSSAPSLLPSTSSTSKRPSAVPKLQFSSMPPPRARAPLKNVQAPSNATSGTATEGGKAGLKKRESRIGLGRPSVAGK
ncbi:hypothetical protein JCM8547_002229 [Rhodosporidiobolus lusitaniae]